MAVFQDGCGVAPQRPRLNSAASLADLRSVPAEARNSRLASAASPANSAEVALLMRLAPDCGSAIGSNRGRFGTIASVYDRWATSDRLIGRPPKETASDAPRR